MKLYKGDIDIKLREHNTSKTYHTGSQHGNGLNSKVTVRGQENRYHLTIKGTKLYKYFIVQFDDNTKVQTSASTINAGKVKNPNQPSVYGVGFHGQGIHKAYINKKPTKEYIVWKGMLQRCYCTKIHINFPTYKGVTVHKRWHNFQLFCEDIQHLENYNEWHESTKFELDKDIKINGNKVYSKETCMFTTSTANSARLNKKQNITGLTYIGTRIEDGHKEEFTNQTEFAEKHTLHKSCINHCILGVQKTTGGWTFEIKKETENK
jgi:hypothetical protein